MFTKIVQAKMNEKKQMTRPKDFTTEFIQIFKEALMPIFFKLCRWNITIFNKATVNLIPKPFRLQKVELETKLSFEY